MGNYVGMLIEEKMAMGLVIIRVIPQKDSSLLISFLKEAKFRFTSIDGHGAEGPVDVIFSIIKRKEVEEFTSIIKRFNPKAFYTIEEVKFVSSGGPANQLFENDFLSMRRLKKWMRKSK